MSSQKRTGTALATAVRGGLIAEYQVTNDDVLAIATSRAEATCREFVRKSQEVYDGFAREGAVLEKKKKDLANSELAAGAKAKLASFEAIFTNLGMKITNSDFNFSSFNTPEVSIDGDDDFDYDGETDEEGLQNGMLVGVLCVDAAKSVKRKRIGYGNRPIDTNIASGRLNMEFTVAPSEELLGVVAAISKNERDLQAAQKELSKWRLKMADIPTFERRIKADLATRKLNDTEEGRAILDTMTATFEREVLGLEGPGETIEVSAAKPKAKRGRK